MQTFRLFLKTKRPEVTIFLLIICLLQSETDRLQTLKTKKGIIKNLSLLFSPHKLKVGFHQAMHFLCYLETWKLLRIHFFIARFS